MENIFSDACCFTGHRYIPRENMLKIQTSLCKAIETMVHKNVRTFLCGGAMGFDMMAAWEVLKLKDKYPYIKLHLIIPFKGHNDKWNTANKFQYEQISEQCDKLVYIADEYSNESILLRNRTLVDNSAYCIAYLDTNHFRGGTKYTVNYAIKQNVEVILLT